MVSYINNHVNALYTKSKSYFIKISKCVILLKMLLGKDMAPDSSYKRKVGFDVKVMNMMFSIKTYIPQAFYDKHRDNGVKSLLQVSEKWKID